MRKKYEEEMESYQTSDGTSVSKKDEEDREKWDNALEEKLKEIGAVNYGGQTFNF